MYLFLYKINNDTGKRKYYLQYKTIIVLLFICKILQIDLKY